MSERRVIGDFKKDTSCFAYYPGIEVTKEVVADEEVVDTLPFVMDKDIPVLEVCYLRKDQRTLGNILTIGTVDAIYLLAGTTDPKTVVKIDTTSIDGATASKESSGNCVYLTSKFKITPNMIEEAVGYPATIFDLEFEFRVNVASKTIKLIHLNKDLNTYISAIGYMASTVATDAAVETFYDPLAD